MDAKSYFKYLSTVLHESKASEAIEREMKEVPKNLDDGTGLEDPELIDTPKIVKKEEVVIPEEDPTMVPAEIPAEEEIQEDPEMAGLDDAAYMDQAPVEVTIDDITKREQKVKLFDQFDNLKSTVEYTIESFRDRVSADLLDREQIKLLDFAIDKCEKIVMKIRDYQLNSFITREYEESLYTYMLLRSELLTIINFIRKGLDLNSYFTSQ